MNINPSVKRGIFIALVILNLCGMFWVAGYAAGLMAAGCK